MPEIALLVQIADSHFEPWTQIYPTLSVLASGKNLLYINTKADRAIRLAIGRRNPSIPANRTLFRRATTPTATDGREEPEVVQDHPNVQCLR
jgi:hypothetical protein